VENKMTGHLNIEFKRLSDVKKSDIIELMNHPIVLKHMPLAKGTFDDAAYDAFIAAKEELWKQHGYGPWAFYHDGKFIGWGGLQFEEGDADLALVLHPNHWGMGKAIYDLIIERAFGKMGFLTITALLPPSRIRFNVMKRLGFKPDGELILD
jgi:[ribosomal protein S5]-alanine N-acetyltransferase